MPATSLRQGCSPKPIFCSLLQAGQRFQGIQNSWKLVKDLDYWTVHVVGLLACFLWFDSHARWWCDIRKFKTIYQRKDTFVELWKQ